MNPNPVAIVGDRAECLSIFFTSDNRFIPNLATCRKHDGLCYVTQIISG